MLSHTQTAPAPWASAATAATSVTRHSGLDGVSTHTIFVRGLSAALIAAASVMSTKSTTRPHGTNVSRSSLPVPK